ncbi:hypothetical protein [Staphylococcus haemolyticus]|nr:hypothetical protein [Staphylococcus haemolyticus]
MKDALSKISNQDLMEIYEIHKKDVAAKSLLEERGFSYNHKTKK